MSRVQIAGEDLQFATVPDPVPEPLTGETIVKLAGAEEPKDFIVIQWLTDGGLETLRLDEKAQSDGGSTSASSCSAVPRRISSRSTTSDSNGVHREFAAMSSRS